LFHRQTLHRSITDHPAAGSFRISMPMPIAFRSAGSLFACFALASAVLGQNYQTPNGNYLPQDQGIRIIGGNFFLPGQTAEGSSVSLSLYFSSSGTDPSIAPPTEPFQWYFNDQPLAGATATTLDLTNLTAAQTGNYHLGFTQNGQRRTSNAITLNVRPAPPKSVDPSFTARLPAHWLTTNLMVDGAGRIVLWGHVLDPASAGGAAPRHDDPVTE
jgi:hypothetical protein